MTHTMPQLPHLVRSILLLALASLPACNGGGGGTVLAPQAPSAIQYATNPANYVLDVEISANAPTVTGGTPTEFTVAPALPAGLALDGTTGVVSGTPTAVTAAADYTVTAANQIGSASVLLHLTVSPEPILVTTQPAAQNVHFGGTATFSVAASGSGTLSYQWFADSVAIGGATSASYTTPALVLGDDADYTVEVTDEFGGTVTSEVAALRVFTGDFETGPSLARGRIDHTATRLPNGNVLLAGGTDVAVLASAELYDPFGHQILATGSMTSIRTHHAAVLLADGTVLLTGGGISVLFTLPLTVTDSAETFDPVTGTFTATLGTMAAARSDHTATRLPNGKVLIVGGNSAGGSVASAELYDPATRTFSATGSLAAARQGHTATLLGDGRVLVTGGIDGLTTLDTAEVYDPANGTFAAVGTLTAPRTRHRAALLADGRVLLAGGAGSLFVPLATAEIFDPATDTFAATGALATARIAPSLDLLPDGEVLVAGGTANGSALAEAELFDPTSGTFGPTATLATARQGQTSTLLPNGKVLVTGGADANMGLASIELFDVETPVPGAFSATGDLASPRQDGAMTLLGDGRVLASHGSDGSALLTACEVFDPATGSWSNVASALVSVRQFHTATLLANGKVLIAGGNDGSADLTSAELFDPATATFTATTGSLATARSGAKAILLGNGKVLIVGGTNATISLDSAELYDPATATFATTGAMAVPRSGHSATLLGNGKILIAGGYDFDGIATTPHDTAELYDPATGTFTATGGMSRTRIDHAAIRAANGLVLIAGGTTGVTYNAHCEVYDPVAGTFAVTGAMNNGRAGAMSVSLPGSRILVVGGESSLGNPVATAEVYDLVTGTFAATGAMALARYRTNGLLLGTGQVLVAGGRDSAAATAAAELYR